MVTGLRRVAAIVAKDLVIEWRTRDLLTTMVLFAFVSVVLFSFAIDFSVTPFRLVGAPVIWLVFVYTGFAGLSRSFALEADDGCFDALLLAPFDRSLIYLGKLLVNGVVLFALELVVLGLAFLLLNRGSGGVDLDATRWAILVGIVALNTLGFAGVGTLFALVAQRSRRGDVLLPVVQAVLTLPVLIPAVLATRTVLDTSAPLADLVPLVRLSAVFDVVVVALSFALFDQVVEE